MNSNNIAEATGQRIRHNPEHLTHPKYRADIDGLRAIAILSVVGYHAFPFWIKGGFIGVDIFFVISGFLISTIIVGSLERNSFSFVEFYGRRIKRIFPALLLVLIACFAFGWFALLADEYKQLGKHIAGGAGFISNYLLWNESGYFDNAAETKPLLHLWSLGIEEQYYILWPLLLWLAWKQRFNLLTITIAVAAISFALNVGKVQGDSVAAFYSPQTRFWELMVGSVLAYMTQHKQTAFPEIKYKLDAWLSKMVYAQAPEANGKLLRNILSILGTALIAFGVLVITKEKFFPGWWAVLPTLGAVLIILAGAHAWLNRVVLSHRVLVWFGLISFPLYLWHWPLLAFARIVESETPSFEIRIALVIISIALAWLTYRVIEKPIRFGKYSKSKSIILFVLMIVVGYVGYNSFKRDGLEFRSTAKQFKIISDAMNDWKYPQGLMAQTRDGIEFYGTSTQAPSIVFFGDSHIEQFGPRIVSLSHEFPIQPTMFLSGGGCPPIPNVLEDKHPQCVNHVNRLLEFAKRTKTLQTIVIGGCWNCYFIKQTRQNPSKDDEYNYYYLSGEKKIFFRGQNGKERALHSLKEFLRDLSINYDVYLLLDNPQDMNFDPKNIVGKRSWIFESFVMPEQRIQIPLEQIQLNNELRSIGFEAGVKIIDQIPNLCTDNSCIRINHDGRPVYKDDNHLRPYFVIEHGGYIDQVFQTDSLRGI